MVEVHSSVFLNICRFMMLRFVKAYLWKVFEPKLKAHIVRRLVHWNHSAVVLLHAVYSVLTAPTQKAKYVLWVE